VLVDDRVASSDQSVWQEKKVPLDDLALAHVELCLETTWEGNMGKDRAEWHIVWESPEVVCRDARYYQPRPQKPKSAQEEKLEEEQLRAIGYIQ
jgi:hypothetical protein